MQIADFQVVLARQLHHFLSENSSENFKVLDLEMIIKDDTWEITEVVMLFVEAKEHLNILNAHKSFLETEDFVSKQNRIIFFFKWGRITILS